MRESRTRKGLLTPGVCKLKGHAIITDIIYIMVPHSIAEDLAPPHYGSSEPHSTSAKVPCFS